ncbi:MAG TPA: hypothetical protein VHO69_05350 [Phototrophicaceae bacterium]|nr:hypothetical protein [Phototrophicaceae bacterium]
MMGRDGNISVIRIGALAAIVGVLIIIGAAISFFIDRASRQVPLDIELYPGAMTWGQRANSGSARTVYYQISGEIAPEQVKDFYQQKMDQFYPADTERELRECKRDPRDGNFNEYDEGVPNKIPYQWSCLFDRSGFQVTQFTRVNIMPGINDTAGMTIIAYEQTWQP